VDGVRTMVDATEPPPADGRLPGLFMPLRGSSGAS